MDQKVENEMIIMQRIKHDHIVRYIEHIDWDDRLLVIIMDYVPGGDLGRLISDRGALPHEDVQLISRQMLSALAYLHENNITHRDVKPDNILIESYRPSLFVKLTDFGLSKIVDNEQTFLRTFCGTLLYCAPEVYSEYNEYDEYGRRLGRQALARSRRVRKRYDHAVDVWSLGGVLFYALSGSPPYPARNGISHSELLHQIMTTRLNIVPLTQAKVSGEGIDFLTQMLERRPDKRASMKDLLQHRWAGGNGMPATTVPQSDDEVSDEEQVLQVRASQLSLEDKERLLFAGQLDPLAALYDVDEEESIEDSQKENYTFCPQDPPGGRLFGEVDINLSAIGPSGAIPANRLNLPVSIASSGIIGDMVSEVADSYETQTRIISRPDSDRRSNNGGASLSLSASHGGHSRSIDQLNNATFDESSQDLGGAESILEALNMKSLGGSHLREFRDSELNTSKRRAESDGSDSREQLAPRDKPIFKRLKSETMLEPGPEIEEHELPLFARMPSATRHIASRVIDSPVHKATFWSSSDKSTWHLRYPEMTQLQLDAFNAACQGSGEAFQPGASPLWDLACKYFPPTYAGEEDEGGPSQDSPTLGRTVSSMTVPAPGPDEEEVVPSTPLPGDMSSLPDTLPPDASFSGRRSEPPPRFRRVVATLRSVPSPGVEDIGISMAEPMLSWGRAPQNTRVFPNSKEDRIPKFAFRIMLWAEDYSPVRNMHPWARSPTRQREAAFAFYVSTMATYGIRVNGFSVSSRESRYSDQHPGNWLRLYDGDQIEIWRAKDSNARIALTFRCNWSGSTQPRPAAPPDSLFGSPPSQLLPALEPEATARKIAEAYLRAEKRLRDPKTKDERMEEADFDMDLRLDNVERERHQSQLFERKRIAACRMLRAPANRRHSPASKGVAGAARTSGTDSVNGNGNGDDGRIGNLVLGMGDTLGGRFKVASSGRS
jgi:serine/threonine protein kinase